MLRNGVLTQLSQNGGKEDTIANIVPVANATLFTQTLTGANFSHAPKVASKAVVKTN